VIAFLNQLAVLAQSAPAAPVADPNQPIRWMGTLAVVMVLFYFMFIRPQKRKEQDLQDTLKSLKENDRVVTIGGIHGVITNVQRDAERVTIRVDEATGAKLRVNMSAIARVVKDDVPESAPAGATKS
jgi:preprotein translocase subunit YajC